MRKPVMENNSHCDIRLGRVRVLPNMSQFTTHYNNSSKRREKFSVRSFSSENNFACRRFNWIFQSSSGRKWRTVNKINANIYPCTTEVILSKDIFWAQVGNRQPSTSFTQEPLRSHWNFPNTRHETGNDKNFRKCSYKIWGCGILWWHKQSAKVESYFPPLWKFSANQNSSRLQEWPAVPSYKAVCCLTRLVIEGLHNCLKKMANAFEIVETVKKELALTEVTVTQFAAGVAPHHHNSHSERPQN